MRVVWLDRALDDIEAIRSYIADDNPIAARGVFGLIQFHVGQLGLHPHIGRPGRAESTRELIVSGTPYVVPYRVSNDKIEILAVIHGARRWPKKL